LEAADGLFVEVRIDRKAGVTMLRMAMLLRHTEFPKKES
jgi:hypothetical protein